MFLGTTSFGLVFCTIKRVLESVGRLNLCKCASANALTSPRHLSQSRYALADIYFIFLECIFWSTSSIVS